MTANSHKKFLERISIGVPMPTRAGVKGIFNRAFFWTDERATLPYDIWVIAILAFVWLTPPAWLGDPMASGTGMIGWIRDALAT